MRIAALHRRTVGGRDPVPACDVEFTEFATAYGAHLRRTAFLLCHDWHLAEDLAQTALAKTYVAWRRSGAPQSPHAFCQTVLLRSFLDHRRRRSSGEVSLAELTLLRLSEHAGQPAAVGGGPCGGSDLRLTLVDALRSLPPRDRAIVVLRYWEDLGVDQVAALVGVSPSVVKSQSARSLERLRVLLGDTFPDDDLSGPTPL
jgi:RNA polymerase sigma-70 factor (sigma-E family)